MREACGCVPKSPLALIYQRVDLLFGCLIPYFFTCQFFTFPFFAFLLLNANNEFYIGLLFLVVSWFFFSLPTLLPFLCTKSRTRRVCVAGAGLSPGKKCVSSVTVICTVSEFLIFISCLPRKSQGACRPVDIYAAGEKRLSSLLCFHLLNVSFIFFPPPQIVS